MRAGYFLEVNVALGGSGPLDCHDGVMEPLVIHGR